MTTMLLVRHAPHDRLGRTLCGRMPGVSLGEAGRAAAGSLARALAPAGLASVRASPLARTAETALAIASACRRPLETDDDLLEIDFGAWTGLDFERLAEDPAWERWNRLRAQSRPPGGETMLEAQLRVVRAMERARALHPSGTVALVSHGDVIKAALAWALGLPLGSYDRFDIDPASVSRVGLDEWGARVLGVNETLRA